MDAERILIAGGGIAGLACAVALARAGAVVRVLERAREPREAGAGITLWNNALAVLAEWGLADAVVAAGAVLERGELRSWRGERLVATPLAAVAARAGAPAVALVRARLVETLASALPDGAFVPGAPCAGFEERDGGVVLRLEDGREERGALLIGCEGLSSRVRAAVVGDAPPRYAGYTCWRGIAALSSEHLPPGTAWELWGRGARFGLVRLDGERVYWFLTANAPPGGRDDDATAAVTERVRGWPDAVREAVRRTEPGTLRRDDIVDRAPLDRWAFGRVALAGDAAHPMTPNLGQGACQAIEDAAALARAVTGLGPVPAALARYEGERRRRANAIVLRSRRLGWIGQRSHPLACAVRDRLMAWTPPAWTRRAYESSAVLPRRR